MTTDKERRRQQAVTAIANMETSLATIEAAREDVLPEKIEAFDKHLTYIKTAVTNLSSHLPGLGDDPYGKHKTK